MSRRNSVITILCIALGYVVGFSTLPLFYNWSLNFKVLGIVIFLLGPTLTFVATFTISYVIIYIIEKALGKSI